MWPSVSLRRGAYGPQGHNEHMDTAERHTIGESKAAGVKAVL